MPEEPIYEPFAREYAEHAAESPYNAFYDRPAVLDLVGDVDGRVVLDAGCGPGYYAEALVARGAQVIAVDQSPTFVAIARERLGPGADVRVHDLADPLSWLADGTVDVAVLALVINYVDDRIPLLREISRVLGPGGTLVVSTTHPMNDWRVFGGSYFDAGTVEGPLKSDGSWVVRGWRRPLTDVCEEFHAAGFVIERLVEPRPVPAMAQRYPRDHAELERSPAFVAFRLRPAGAVAG